MKKVRHQIIYMLKAFARRVVWGPSDLFNRNDRDTLSPPRRLSFVGRGDFDRTGREYLEYFKDLGDLTPDCHVLDMGCGIGRMAIPLMSFLQEGSYAGFDVNRGMVRWCERNITRRRPSFEFTWAPVYNSKYNPFGDLAGVEFRFPYEDSSVDFAFATSLFTHMMRNEVRHYLAEVARVLRPTGTCLLTFFLLSPAAEEEIAARRSSFDFRHKVDGGLTTDSRQPEEAVAFQVSEVRAMLAEAGLTVSEPIHYGLWANTPDGLAGQDIIVASREG